ncbi:MAG TPA: protein phosphatase 2C domain-containing protein, partial [Armatimonadota bacterium]|nr:protein phosphatase 2C domain-containing protein [Armatimonadota bacterium]
RETNEDSYLALAGDSAPCGTKALLGVADGIGGQGHGAEASSTALKMLADVFSASCTIANAINSDIPHLLRYSLQKANAAVFQAQVDDKSKEGMGTTCIAAAVTDDAVHLVSVGDSRAYILRKGELLSITQDEWIKRSDGITFVNQAVGLQPILPTEPITYPIQDGDQLILCTDGLTDCLPEDVICQMLNDEDEGKVCVKLAQTAACQPEADNVTVVIARLTKRRR